MCLAQGHNTVTQVRLEPAALRTRVKHSTTEPLCSLSILHANVGHFGHRHFGLGRFGPDILAVDISAKENVKVDASAITINCVCVLGGGGG